MQSGNLGLFVSLIVMIHGGRAQNVLDLVHFRSDSDNVTLGYSRSEIKF
jgi:hypothetical protein